MTDSEFKLLIGAIIIVLSASLVWFCMLVAPVRCCPRCREAKWVYKDMRNGYQSCAKCNIHI